MILELQTISIEGAVRELQREASGFLDVVLTPADIPSADFSEQTCRASGFCNSAFLLKEWRGRAGSCY